MPGDEPELKLLVKELSRILILDHNVMEETSLTGFRSTKTAAMVDVRAFGFDICDGSKRGDFQPHIIDSQPYPLITLSEYNIMFYKNNKPTTLWVGVIITT